MRVTPKASFGGNGSRKTWRLIWRMLTLTEKECSPRVSTTIGDGFELRELILSLRLTLGEETRLLWVFSEEC